MTGTTLLITAYEVADGPATMLVMRDERVVCKYQHPTGLGGSCRLGSEIFTVDRRGTFFRVKIGCREIALEEVAQASTAEDAHDLTQYGKRLAVACPQGSLITLLEPTTGHTSVVRPWKPPCDYPDPYHFNSLLRYRGKWLLSMFTRSPREPSSGWAETPSDAGALMWWCDDEWEDEPFAIGLCMPHSLRAHRGHVWWCDSGNKAVVNSGGRRQKFGNLTRGLDFRGPQGAVGLSAFRNVRPENLTAAGYAVFDIEEPEEQQVSHLPDSFQEVYDLLLLDDELDKA